MSDNSIPPLAEQAATLAAAAERVEGMLADAQTKLNAAQADATAAAAAGDVDAGIAAQAAIRAARDALEAAQAQQGAIDEQRREVARRQQAQAREARMDEIRKQIDDGNASAAEQIAEAQLQVAAAVSALRQALDVQGAQTFLNTEFEQLSAEHDGREPQLRAPRTGLPVHVLSHAFNDAMSGNAPFQALLAAAQHRN